MDTAKIRLKFKPLIQTIPKNESKCCLEIVPEVSCIENLDKMEWKHYIDAVEYVIPVTYKITLKRKQTAKMNITESLDKTYHSCIDLLPPSSLTNIDMGSGDVPRNVSDTIISKFIANFAVGDMNDTNNSKKQYKLEKKSNHTIIGTKNEERTISKASSAVNLKPYSTYLIVNKPVKKLHKKCETSCHKISAETSCTSSEISKRNLSVSPICSIDTNSFPNSTQHQRPITDIDVFSLNAVFSRLFNGDTNNKQSIQMTELPIVNMEPRIKLPYGFDDVVNFLHPKPSRELPEMRVAKFVRDMENEIMPLKMLLNNIYRKCSELGVCKQLSQRHRLLKDDICVMSTKQSEVKYIKTEKQSKSNRVVYSIVFDG